ncbi:MAG: branched-chain amino acid ABC transporter permease [Acidimicrobiia bacterium]|nr:branched-chain amino acid ABC transporter permease [Acidimicrobiia bacterium]MYC58295.1 branched-chain amino acid ABC transporter permease [Acidimicrobiia bacterium]MYG93470.1 branched-chain amino acid ABC transporter permease [Acidimicrobiia bacterium]MYI29998.1 branched-chain amino acid ABC transporter permease [Acidimicrobiia bacterium]
MEFDIIITNAARAAVGPEALILALAAIGLNMHFGYTGLLNFGQVGFMLLGAYGTSVAVATFGWSLWLGVLLGLILATAFAITLGLPTLRLHALLFAIVTIAAAEIVRILVGSTDAIGLTGGPLSISFDAGAFYDLNPYPDGPNDRYGAGTFEFTGQQLWVMTVGWTLVALVSVGVFLLVRSPWGRVLKSIREDQDAARSLGKNVFTYKLQALVIGGLIAGLGGVLDAIKTSGADPNGFRPQVTFFAYAALLLGGLATYIGPVLGAILFWFLRELIESFLRQLVAQTWLPDAIANFFDGAEGIISVGMVGLALILLMLFRPQGIVGSRNEMQLNG